MTLSLFTCSKSGAQQIHVPFDTDLVLSRPPPGNFRLSTEPALTRVTSNITVTTVDIPAVDAVVSVAVIVVVVMVCGHGLWSWSASSCLLVYFHGDHHTVYDYCGHLCRRPGGVYWQDAPRNSGARLLQQKKLLQAGRCTSSAKHSCRTEGI